MRKQVYELTAADFDAHSVWEFALDEEGQPGQDEATVRPFDTGGQPVPSGGMFVVRATFTLANGKRLAGYVYYTPDVPATGAAYGPLANLQPNVITPNGQVMFWYGRYSLPPEAIAEAYGKLGASRTEVFPVRFASDVPLETGPIQGTLEGFCYLADKRTGWFSKTTRVETIT